MRMSGTDNSHKRGRIAKRKGGAAPLVRDFKKESHQYLRIFCEELLQPTLGTTEDVGEH